MPGNTRCSPGRDGTISDTDTSTTSTASTTNSNSKEKKTSITMAIARLDGGVTKSHGETRRQHLHLHLQLRGGRNGKRVGAHGNLHHLRNGGDFGFLEKNFRKFDGGCSTVHAQTLHIQRSAVCSQARNASHALGSRIA